MRIVIITHLLNLKTRQQECRLFEVVFVVSPFNSHYLFQNPNGLRLIIYQKLKSYKKNVLQCKFSKSIRAPGSSLACVPSPDQAER